AGEPEFLDRDLVPTPVSNLTDVVSDGDRSARDEAHKWFALIVRVAAPSRVIAHPAVYEVLLLDARMNGYYYTISDCFPMRVLPPQRRVVGIGHPIIPLARRVLLLRVERVGERRLVRLVVSRHGAVDEAGRYEQPPQAVRVEDEGVVAAERVDALRLLLRLVV